jgi:hypothetical protein
MAIAVNPLTPLILACGRGSLTSPGNPEKAAELQAACIANPVLINTRGNSAAPELPLDLACYWGHLPAVQALVAAGAVTGVKPIAVGGGPLGQAAHSGNFNLVTWIWNTGLDQALEPEVGVKAVGGTGSERLQVVQFLLSKGLPVVDDMAVLAIKSSPEVAALLVTSGRLNPDRMAALEPRISTRDHPYAHALLPDALNALYVAIHKGDAGAVSTAIADGNPVNGMLPGASRFGTPLHYALLQGRVAIASVLLGAGADPAALSPWGQSIVGAAAMSDSVEAVNLAVRVAPPSALEAVERKGASFRNTAPLVAAIISKGANVVKIVEVLLAAGADPNNAATSGAPAIFWPVYQLQDVHAATAAGFTTAKASSIMKALAQGNSKGQKADLDLYNAAVRSTPRNFAKSAGIVL